MWDLTAHLVQRKLSIIVVFYYNRKTSLKRFNYTSLNISWEKVLCSVNITLCINFHLNSLQLLKQYESKTFFQIDFQFISLSYNLTCHLVSVFRGSLDCWARCCLIRTLDFNAFGSISFPFCSYSLRFTNLRSLLLFKCTHQTIWYCFLN